jgi:hypothetical protein
MEIEAKDTAFLIARYEKMIMKAKELKPTRIDAQIQIESSTGIVCAYEDVLLPEDFPEYTSFVERFSPGFRKKIMQVFNDANRNVNGAVFQKVSVEETAKLLDGKFGKLDPVFLSTVIPGEGIHTTLMTWFRSVNIIKDILPAVSILGVVNMASEIPLELLICESQSKLAFHCQLFFNFSYVASVTSEFIRSDICQASATIALRRQNLLQEHQNGGRRFTGASVTNHLRNFRDD